MRRIILESPYAGDIERNTAYAQAALRDCLTRGESPLASHLLYTQPGVLNDNDKNERALGISAGFVWRECADATVAYTDLGLTQGMILGIEHALKLGHTVELRSLGPTWRKPQ